MNLKNASVLITRPIHQAENLCGLIEKYSGRVVRFPTIEITPLPISEDDTQLVDWLIFTSVNAVMHYCSQIDDDKMTSLKLARCAAIGKATQNALKKRGWQVHLSPDNHYSSEALLAMSAMQNVENERIRVIKGVGGRDKITTHLHARGANVLECCVYQRDLPKSDNTFLCNLLQHKKIDILTATSNDALKHLLIMIDSATYYQLFSLPLVVMSERVGDYAKEKGFKHIVIAEHPSDEAILNSVNTLINGEKSG